jgi:hypothetical protein
MKKLFVISLLILSSSILYAQAIFPDLTGNTLLDAAVQLPKDTKGKYTLVGVAYSKKAEEDLKTWFQPIYYKFKQKSKDKGLFDFDYDVNIYFVPMFSGVNQAAAGKATKEMKKGIEPDLHPHVLIYKGNIKEYKEKLNLEAKDTPYFFVLNKEGKIIYTTEGKFTEQKLEEIEDKIE